jgi:putative DNA primase/helicase
MAESPQVKAQIDAALALVRSPGAPYVPPGGEAKASAPRSKAAPAPTSTPIPVERESLQTLRTAPQPQSKPSPELPPLPAASAWAEACQSEQWILGAVLADNSLYAAAQLDANHFYLSAHRLLWRAITALITVGKPADPVTVAEDLKQRRELSGLGATPHAFLASLSEGVMRHRKSVSAWAHIVRTASAARSLAGLMETSQKRLADGDAFSEVVASLRLNLEGISTESDDAGKLQLLKGTEITDRDDPFILPGRLPDDTAIGVHGRPGDGKTTAAMLIAADLSVGKTPYSGMPCAPRNILVMSNEDSPSRIRKLFAAAGGNLTRLYVENVDSLWQLTALPSLEAAIHTRSIGCAVVDSLASHSGKADLNSHQDTSQLLVPLRALAEKHHCVIFVVHHLNKSLSVDHIAKVAGSIGITASFRHNIHVVPDPESPELRLLVNGKSNLAPPNVPALRFKLFPVGWAGESPVSIDDVYRVTAEPDEKPGKAVAWLRDSLADGEWHDAGKLQQQATQGFDLSRRSIFRAAETLDVERRKAGFGGRAEWRLRSAVRETNTAVAAAVDSQPRVEL